MTSTIDPAIWRRFGLSIDIGMPGDDERYAILGRYLHPMTLPDSALEWLTEVTVGAPPSLLRQLMEGIKRDLILAPRLGRTATAGDVVGRVLASVRPHPEYEQPPLWSDRTVRKALANLAWPPTMAAVN